MGTCIWCGKKAGFLRHAHKTCEKIHRASVQAVSDVVVTAARGADDLDGAVSRVTALASQGWIDAPTLRSALMKGFGSAVGSLVEASSIVTEAQEATLVALAAKLGLQQSELNATPAFQRLVKSGVLRDLSEGKVPARFRLEGAAPFNLQRGESLVWAFSAVNYFEDKTRRTFVGGSQGVSVRVARGVYYHASGFQGRPVESHGLDMIEGGTLGVTTQRVYFVGPTKSFRVPFNKIVSFQPYSDALGIFRDAANARLQVFVTGDGWFTYNLVTNLARLEL